MTATRGKDVILPTALVFENLGFCRVTPYYSVARLRYEIGPDILFHCLSPDCVINDQRSYYNFTSLGNVTLRASNVTEGLYLMAFAQLCPATSLRLTFNITFTGGE